MTLSRAVYSNSNIDLWGVSLNQNIPPNLNLPFFAYGSLKTGELGHGLIKHHTESIKTLSIDGYTLAIVDGLAQARKADSNSLIHGEAFNLTQRGYEIVADFEKVPDVYQWEEASSPLGKVNLVTTSNEIWTRHHEASSWGTEDDLYFASVVPWAKEKMSEINRRWTASRPHIENDPFLFLDLQSLYNTLWTLLERIALFQYGQFKTPSRMVNHLRQQEIWTSALKEANPNWEQAARPHRYPDRRPKKLDRHPFETWKVMRNNIVHRGKAGGNEFSTLRVAAEKLLRVEEIVLISEVPRLANHWSHLTTKN